MVLFVLFSNKHGKIWPEFINTNMKVITSMHGIQTASICGLLYFTPIVYSGLKMVRKKVPKSS